MLVLYLINIKAFKKKYKIDPRAVTKNDKLMYMLERYRDLIFIFVGLSISIYSFFPSLYFLLVPINYLNIEIIRVAGVFILIGSMILTRASQVQLKGAWRIGIDRTNIKTELITTGIYSKSRNPIALSMLLSALGLFFVTPNMITFTIIAVVYVIFSIRILLEEEHLYKLHGEAYESYRKKTRRWI